MKCPYCSSEELKVKDTRKNYETCILRTLTCLDCNRNFDTIEGIDQDSVKREMQLRESA